MSSENIHSVGSFINPSSTLKCRCDVCGKTLAKKSNLTRHFRKVHGIDPFPKNLKHKCDHCHRQFNNLNQLRYHQRKEHIFEENNKRSVLPHGELDFLQLFEDENLKEEQSNRTSEVKRHECPLCNESFCRPDFPSHFENKHKLILQVETLEFDSFSDFMEWKVYMENETQSNYYKERTSKYGQMSYHYFICNRSGTYKSKGLGMKYSKGQGSCKINAYCPSSIRVQERRDGNCFVSYQKVHVGHKQDFYNLDLYAAEKQEIITADSSNNVLENMHSNSSTENEFKTLSLKIKTDLHNNETSFCYQNNLFDSNIKKKIYFNDTQNEYVVANTVENRINYNLMSEFIDENSQSLTVADEDSESLSIMDEDSECITVVDEDSESLATIDDDSESFKEGNEVPEALVHREESLIMEFAEIVKYASTMEEYDVIEKTLISLKSKINAIKSNAPSMQPSIMEKITRHNYIPLQKSIFLKDQTKLKTPSITETFAESQNIALSLIVNNEN